MISAFSKSDITVFTKYIKPYKQIMFLTLFVMLCESLVAMASPWLAGTFTNTLINDHDTANLKTNQVLLLWLTVLLIQFSLKYGNQYLSGNLTVKVLADINIDLYNHIQAIPLYYFNETKKGKLLSLLTNDIFIISNYMTTTLLSIAPQLFTFFLALAFISVINPLIAVIALVFVPLFFILLKLLGRSIRPLSIKLGEQNAEIIAIATENLFLLPLIKSFSREKLEYEKYKKANEKMVKLTEDYMRIKSALSPFTQLIAASLLIFLLWLISINLGTGEIDISNMVRLILYGMLLIVPVSSLAEIYGQTQHARAAAERIRNIFLVKPEKLEDNGINNKIKGDIEFKKVCFNYPDREQVLDNFNLSIKTGETVAITGLNGTGKSTLIYLLQRFAEPCSGEIFIDGKNINEYSLYELRKQIGVVHQNILLLNGSIRENIAYGNSKATIEDIMTAAKSACALDFVNKLPDKFDTIIGDQGIKLSGGQKQRLALARIILLDPPVIALDEATAMFDPEGEKSFIQDSYKILSKRTVILITHKQATLALAERIVQMAD